jgi:osmoprotectant transport system ATP-binding protein
MTQTADRSGVDTGTTIALRGITKVYPGQARPAVDALDLDVPTGAVVALVGPSGCGKTTTLKMMNRLIEPTSGQILLDGEDVTDVDADELRRRIGYVIQQVGLFPHFTIGENIAVVPRLVGWDRNKVAARVDELLALVGLEPREYRDRYPRQLSGGQQQRVGVARGLAADPAVVLMDEPFGAIDPITRERLQNELLDIQRQIAKTICIVTHDLGEAVLLGDRIAVLGPGGVLAQYDTPERVLTAPADEFVAEFVGAGAAVRRLSLLALGRLDLEPVTAEGAAPGGGPVYRADGAGRITAWAAPDGGDDAPPLVTVPRTGTVYDAVDAMLDARAPLVAVVDDDGRPHGALRWEALVRELPTAPRR